MDPSVIRERYEQFVSHLRGRMVRIDYDPRHDSLYVFGEEAWTPEVGEKPRTLAVASGIHLDLLLSTHTVYGTEIDEFDHDLRTHGDRGLIAWWDKVRADPSTPVDGDRLAEAMRHTSFV